MTQSIDIPVSIVGDVAAVAALHRIEDALKRTGTGASAADPKVKSFSERFAGLATGARHVNELAEFMQRLGGVIHDTATSIGELAAEQQRLDANSVRLGLNFRQAAEQAGGFVSEVETMTLATSLADRGIRATQEELNALARVGMSRAAATGKNLGEVFDSLTDSVLEGGEEMGKFGGNLLRVADGTHTAGERMRAFVDHARTVAPTMRTAADEMARFRNEVQNAQRTLSTAFAEEFTRLLGLPDAMDASADKARDFNDTLRAIGMTAANIVTVIGGATTAAIGFMVAGVGTLVGSVRVLVAGIGALPRGVRAAQDAMAASGRENFGPDSFVATIGRFSEAAGRAAFGALGGGPDRTSAAPENNPTLASVRAQRERDRRERGRRQSPGGSSTSPLDAELARIEAGLDIAGRMTGSEREARFGVEYEEVGGIVVDVVDILTRLRRDRISVLDRQTRERRPGEDARARTQRVSQIRARIEELKQELRNAGDREGAEARSQFTQRQAPARERYNELSRGVTERARGLIEKDNENRLEAEEQARSRSDEGLRAEAERQRFLRSEERSLEQRRDNLRTFTDFMEEQYHRQINIAREGADAIGMAMRAMGSAAADNLVAWAEGTKTFEEAANEMLATTLSTIAKESAQKAAFNIAEGLFALATYRYDAAGLHFAAAAGYGALAYGAGYAASAVREAAPKKEEDKSRGASEARGAAPMSQGSTTGGGTTVINVAFNGPQFGTGGVVQAARQLAGVLNAGAVQGGVQLNRLALAGTR